MTNVASLDVGNTVFGHPRGLITLFFTEMWERLSYYGMRALLVLFMTDQVINGGMELTDVKATAIYGIYTALVYLVALPGGWIADRLLGAQRAIFYGGIIIMCGHFTLAIPSTKFFFLGLLLIIIGTGLLKPNVSAIVGGLYSPGDPRRDSGFSIFYMGINLGAMLGPLVCGSLGQHPNYGWHYGFGAAGVGMLFGLIQFWKTKKYLGAIGIKPISSGNTSLDTINRKRGWVIVGIFMSLTIITYLLSINGVFLLDPIEIAKKSTYIIMITTIGFFAHVLINGQLNTQEKKRVVVIIALFFGAAMFWSGFEQAGSSLNLFADRYIHLELNWITLYSVWFQSLNSIFIILFAPIFAYFWIFLARKNLNPSTPAKFGFGLIFLAIGFFIMMLASQIVATGEKVMPYWLVMTYLFHTFGELTLSPVGLSATTKLAPKRFAGQMMGMWFVASALGNLIAGQIAGDFNPINIDSFPSQYATIVLTSVGAGIILLIFSKPLKQLMAGVD
tara:strand:+ start:1152 stop:2660 length:1509 start_codon:yes stop_codon:yes gene_type:complete